MYWGENSMDYATTVDKAKEWGVSQRRVAIFCKEGRVKGAELLGRTWFIPKEAKKPIDPRKLKKMNGESE